VQGLFRARPIRRRGVRCSRWRFQQLVVRSCVALPQKVRKILSNVAITVADRPPREGPDAGPALGFYQGTPLGARGEGYSLVLPDKVTIYRIPLLRACHSMPELREEITLTLLHEIGHHVGLDDSELPF
jgi:predicted Zn-dependent protease with MMP-like domain